MTYVVKVFSQKNLQQIQSTNKEIYASVLAHQFDLKVPKPALVEVGSEIIAELQQDEAQKDKELRPGFYYGCEYLNGPVNYSDAMPESLLDVWEMENVFAFDVLLRNVDRRVRKPNLFFKDKSIYLIDHELCLDINKSFEEYTDMDGWQFINSESRKHIFLDHLRKANEKEIIEFDTFQEYFAKLSLSTLDNVATQLEGLGMSIIDYTAINKYLKDAKSGWNRYYGLLRDLLDD